MLRVLGVSQGKISLIMFAQTIVKQKAKWRRAWIEWIQLLNNAQRRKEKEGGKLSEEIRTSCSYYFLVMRQCGIYQGLTKCKQSSLKLIDAIFVRVSQQSRILMFDIVWLCLYILDLCLVIPNISTWYCKWFYGLTDPSWLMNNINRLSSWVSSCFPTSSTFLPLQGE